MDLFFFSGLFGVISLTINSIEFETEDDETVFELKRRFVSLTKGIELEMNQGICEPPATLRYRNKILLDDKTLKQEGLVGGELLMLSMERLPRHLRDELQQRSSGSGSGSGDLSFVPPPDYVPT